jgi:hypothetical protein
LPFLKRTTERRRKDLNLTNPFKILAQRAEAGAAQGVGVLVGGRTVTVPEYNKLSATLVIHSGRN